MMIGRLIFAVVLAATALFTFVAGASAATRYAKNDSAVVAGACSDPAVGCRLDYAINSAAASDTVVVLPGDYNVTWPIAAGQIINIEGQAGQPRPRILGDAALATPTINNQKGGTVKHLYVDSKSANAALSTKEVNISDVIARGQSGPAVFAKAGSGAVIRDSVFSTTAGTTNAALQLSDNQVTGPIDVINVTAVASAAGSKGIENGAGGPVTIVNTIARGGTSDITLASGVQNSIVSYSNYRPLASSGINAGAGNRSGDPVFANAASGDFHPLVSSTSTIDVGTAGVAVGLDPDGVTRAVPDIGGFEYVAAGGGGGGGGADPGAGGGSTGDGGGSTTGGSTGTTTTTTTGSGTGTGSGDATSGDGSGDSATVLPPAAPPVLGQSVGLGPVKGAVTVTLPGSTTPVPLENGASVPVGSIIDATEGTVSLTSARDSGGTTQTGQFWGGAFRIAQSRRGDRYTELVLVGALPKCTSRARVNAAARRWSRRRLWGRDRGGRFRTRGRHGSATVRGTRWLTEDRCDGTLFKVTEGAIDVRDNRKRKTVRLKRGGSYLAKSR